MPAVRVPMPPKAAIRPRFRRDGKAYTDPNYRLWLDQAAILIGNAWRRAEGLRYTTPVMVEIVFRPDGFDLGIDDAPLDARRGKFRGDIDNYVKAVLDATQASGIIENDRLVTTLHTRFAGEE